MIGSLESVLHVPMVCFWCASGVLLVCFWCASGWRDEGDRMAFQLDWLNEGRSTLASGRVSAIVERGVSVFFSFLTPIILFLFSFQSGF